MAPQPPRVACFQETMKRSDSPPPVVPPSTTYNPLLTEKNGTQSTSLSMPATSRPKPVPPTTLVEPFGQGKDDSSLPPTPGQKLTDVNKPTCSLNLVCYRSGNCISRQIQVASLKRTDASTYMDMLIRNPELITSDRKLFEAFRRIYSSEICGFWRRYFSLKTLRRLQLLSYTMDSRPVPVPLDEFTMQEVLWAFNHPESFSDQESEWVDWVFRLRQRDKRHALQFVEDWNGMRIAIVGTIPCVLSTAVGITWSAMGGDIQTAFTVAGFILTVATVLLALLAVISGIDSSRRS